MGINRLRFIPDKTHPFSFGGEFIADIGLARLLDHAGGSPQSFNFRANLVAGPHLTAEFHLVNAGKKKKRAVA